MCTCGACGVALTRVRAQVAGGPADARADAGVHVLYMAGSLGRDARVLRAASLTDMRSILRIALRVVCTAPRADGRHTGGAPVDPSRAPWCVMKRSELTELSSGSTSNAVVRGGARPAAAGPLLGLT